MIPAEEFNPYQAPAATLDRPGHLEPNSNAEIIRRTYLNHESSVKGIGSLCYLGAIACGLGVIFGGLILSGIVPGVRPPQAQAVAAMGLGLGVFLVFGLIYAGVGYGLRRLQPWARWTTIVLIGLAILFQIGQVLMAAALNPMSVGAMLGITLLQLIMPGYMLYLLVSAKGSMVFSNEYHEIIRMTTHIRYKISMLVKILLGMLIFVVLMAIIGATTSIFATK